MRRPSLSRCTVVVAVTGVVLAATGCVKSETARPTAGEGGSQVVKTPESGATSAGAGCAYDKYAGGVEKVDLTQVKVGWAQSEKEANPFRTAETQSMKDEASKRGIDLVVTNAGGDLNKEISDIKGMIAQGVKVMIISPLKDEGLEPALEEAKAKKVPIMTVDRFLPTAKHCEDYVGWIGSNFVDQGKRAGEAMIRETGGTAKAVTLLGSAGVGAAIERNEGYREAIKAEPGIEVVAEQVADFDRTKGQAVMEQLLEAHPDLTAVYAHNDEMALGAVAALKAQGKKPGDVKVISIDGTKGAVQGLADGWLSGVIESNPRFGPLGFKALDDFYGGAGVPQKTIISDKEYTKDNAAAELANAY